MCELEQTVRQSMGKLELRINEYDFIPKLGIVVKVHGCSLWNSFFSDPLGTVRVFW